MKHSLGTIGFKLEQSATSRSPIFRTTSIATNYGRTEQIARIIFYQCALRIPSIVTAGKSMQNRLDAFGRNLEDGAATSVAAGSAAVLSHP